MASLVPRTASTSMRPMPRARSAPSASSGSVPASTTTTVEGGSPPRHTRTPGATVVPPSAVGGGRQTGNATTATATASAAASRPAERRHTTAAASAPARIVRVTPPSRASGSAAVTRATPAIHATRRRVGTCSRAAGAPPTTPATSPADMPHTTTGPAAGTARRLAGSDAAGSAPNVGTSTGATPTWAASVTLVAAANQRGPGRRRASGAASSRIPADAATDRRKPTACTSRGSTSRSPVTASARTRTPGCGRPATAATSAIDAIATARNTDGSHRVNVPNVARTASPRTSRQPSDNRRRANPASVKTNATFSPLTTSRCDRPEARKSSTISGR